MTAARKPVAISLLVGCLLLLAEGGAANRSLQQTGVLPTYQGTPLTVVNAADPAATQTTQATVTVPVAGAQAPVPAATVTLPVVLATTPTAQAPAAPLPVVQTPQVAQTPVNNVAQAPTAQAPVVTPLPVVVNTPAPQPIAQVPPPPPKAVPAPQPVAASPPPVLKAPTPAPAAVLPVIKAPVPAPQAMPAKVTVPAPAPVMVPAPAPAPQSPPQCGIMPQCRLFVEDMLCCDSAGIITNQQHAVFRLQCTHPVNYYSKCLNVTGPSNATAFTQFDTSIWTTSHTVQVNFLEDYMGNATVDIEGPRTNAKLSADCGLYITPCMFNGSIVTKVAPVQGLSFTSLPSDEFLDVVSSINEDISNLDSLVMPNLYYPSACQQQDIGNLEASFFSKDWVSYASGFQNTCNYTAFADALAPTPSSPLNPYASGSVMTASLG